MGGSEGRTFRSERKMRDFVGFQVLSRFSARERDFRFSRAKNEGIFGILKNGAGAQTPYY
jgi:hypothetical protein